jgi:hypothetical protein
MFHHIPSHSKKKGLGWKSGPVFKIQYPMKNRGKDTESGDQNHRAL